MRHNGPVTSTGFGQPDRVVIIGGGPGGYESALVAAQLGAEVTVVDCDGLGGSAVVTDCVPSKTLIATAELMTELAGAPELGVSFEDHEGDAAHHVAVDLGRVNHRVKKLAADQSDDIGRRLEREGVRVVIGHGRLEGTDRVVVDLAEGGTETIEADAVLLATGAAPRTLATARARRRADPDLGAGLRPHRDSVEDDRGRLGRHRRRVRQRLHGPGHRGRAGLLPRPGAARRGRRRRHRARGRADPPRHAGAVQVPDGLGHPRRRRGHRDPHRRPHGHRLALPAGPRVDPQDRRPRPRGGRRRRSTTAASSRSTGSRAPPPAGCTPPATAPAC